VGSEKWEVRSGRRRRAGCLRHWDGNGHIGWARVDDGVDEEEDFPVFGYEDVFVVQVFNEEVELRKVIIVILVAEGTIVFFHPDFHFVALGTGNVVRRFCKGLPDHHGDSRVFNEQPQKSVCRFREKKLMEMEAFEVLKPVSVNDDGTSLLFKINPLFCSGDFPVASPLLIEIG